jgi:RNA polymerase-binding protein DksA
LPGTRKRLCAKELKEFRELLIKRRAMIHGDVTHMHESALKQTGPGSGELSTMPFHMADVGTDNFEHEFVLGIIENEEEELRQIDAALDRIETKAYGTCDCGKEIPKARLRAMPYAKLCIDCKRDEENGGSN